MRVVNVFGIKPHVAPKNISTAATAETSDYMLRLLRKVSKPNGEVDASAVRGNLIYGFTADNGELNDSIEFGTEGLFLAENNGLFALEGFLS